MVSKLDLQKANQLANASREINRAIEILDHGGRVMAMMVGSTPTSEGPPGGFAQVDVSMMDYPQQMVDSIKAQFRTRQTQINSELTAMGVTDVPEAAAARVRPTPVPAR